MFTFLVSKHYCSFASIRLYVYIYESVVLQTIAECWLCSFRCVIYPSVFVLTEKLCWCCYRVIFVNNFAFGPHVDHQVLCSICVCTHVAVTCCITIAQCIMLYFLFVLCFDWPCNKLVVEWALRGVPEAAICHCLVLLTVWCSGLAEKADLLSWPSVTRSDRITMCSLGLLVLGWVVLSCVFFLCCLSLCRCVSQVIYCECLDCEYHLGNNLTVSGGALNSVHSLNGCICETVDCCGMCCLFLCCLAEKRVSICTLLIKCTFFCFSRIFHSIWHVQMCS